MRHHRSDAYSVVYVELGTNDLCGSRSAEAVVQDLLDLVHLLRERGATKVVVVVVVGCRGVTDFSATTS